jgi:hypothetical protein
MSRGGRRVGAGRPKTLERSHNLVIRVEADVLERAKAGAKVAGTTISNEIRSTLARLAGGRRPRPRRSRTSRS